MDLESLTKIASKLCAKNGWSEPKYIDHGASAAVYAIDTQQGKAALKIYDPTYFEGDNALIETKRIELQTQLISHGCKNLIEVLGAAEIPEDRTWYLLMEFCPWSSLDKRLSSVPNEKVHTLIKQLVDAVKFLEGRGLVHRDIKPANIVVSDDFSSLKLLDFGVMRKIAFEEGSGTDGRKFIATAQYSPPEFLLREEETGDFGFNSINIYQIGAVLHDLITKSEIFFEEKSAKNKFILFKAVTEKKPRVVSDEISSRLIALCLASLDKDPVRRSASVKLDDFLADEDDLDALRRRLSGSAIKQKIKSAKPLLSVWENKVRSWGKEAAELETNTLGALTMKKLKLDNGCRWELNFKGSAAPIYLEIVKYIDQLNVYIVSKIDIERTSPVLTIDCDGPNLHETGIAGVFSAQYLYALDVALAS